MDNYHRNGMVYRSSLCVPWARFTSTTAAAATTKTTTTMFQDMLNRVRAQDVDMRNKRVFLRADFDVQLDANKNVIDDTKLRLMLPTIEMILYKKPKVLVLLSHMGDPDGKNESLSLFPVAKALSRMIKKVIYFIDQCVGPAVTEAINKPYTCRVLMLENVRFYAEEKLDYFEKDERALKLGRMLSALCDVYVNDAFSLSHLPHCSLVGIDAPVKTLGLRIQNELFHACEILELPRRPAMLIVGGCDVSRKLKMIDNLIDHVNSVLIGGAISFTFLHAAASDSRSGSGMVHEYEVKAVKPLLEKAKEKNVSILLPTDFTCMRSTHHQSKTPDLLIETRVYPALEIADGWTGADIGPETITHFADQIATANTVFWYGPLGMAEMDGLEVGTYKLLKCVDDRIKANVFSVMFGKEGGRAARLAGYGERLSYISEGGEGVVKLLEGEILPAVVAVNKDPSIIPFSEIVRQNEQAWLERQERENNENNTSNADNRNEVDDKRKIR